MNYKLPGFLAKFIELQQVMWRTNAGLTGRHTYDSRPDAWPRLRRGIVRCESISWASQTDEHVDVELLGQGSSPDLSYREPFSLVAQLIFGVRVYVGTRIPHPPRTARVQRF